MARLLTADDLYALKLASDPQISPDGARVAFVRTTIDRDTYEYARTIWIVPAGGGEPRQFTARPHDAAPRWSPDGRTLAFLRAPAGEVKPATVEERDRGKGKPQLWILPVDGGEARQLTMLRHGAGTPVWSPDGSVILFAAEAGEPDDPEADDAPLHERRVPRVRHIERVWHRTDGHGFNYETRSHLFTVPAAGGEVCQHTDGDWNDGAPSWSPDGTCVAFVSDRTDERWCVPAAQVWVLHVASGEQARVTSEERGCGSPSWSPDGRTLAYLADPRRNGTGHADLWVAPADPATGEERCLTGDFTPTCAATCIDDLRAGHGVLPVYWSRDGHDIYFLASMRGTVHVYA
ncbi:MAG: TolB family protein, partial [Ktedonobacterales bacterium]